MNWFRKSLRAKRASPSSCASVKCSKRHCTQKSTSDADDGQQPCSNSPDMLASLCNKQIEVLDPEDFFHDPDHVRQYKEEGDFLKMMSEWEIVDHPQRHMNFFSGDFEDELIHLKTHPIESELEHELSQSETQQSPPTPPPPPPLAVEEQAAQQQTPPQQQQLRYQLIAKITCEQPRRCRPRLSEMFFGERIETGIIVPTVNIDCKVSVIQKKTDMLSAGGSAGSLPKVKRADRERLQSEAFSQSIMGAIRQSPDFRQKEDSGKVEEEDDDEEDSRRVGPCDHYDIQQFFRLDDNGNILLSLNHIKEVRGCEMSCGKKLCRNYTKGMCIDESYARRRKWLIVLKRILEFLWSLLTGHPRNKINQIGGPGDSVRCYTLQLANDHSSTFAQNIENFISCTKESREAAPQVVMRNMRQFMNGMKNYLVKHGEGKFHQEVENARARLKSDEFLNLDAILETVMHQLVVLPLREHLYGMFVDFYTRSEDIQLLVQNVKYACGRSAADFGIRPSVAPPTSTALQQISNLLLRLQEAVLPLEKLDLFLCIISSIFDATGCPRGQQLGADDFLPILVYVVAKCGFVGAEIEAEFMWGLLQPALLNGEAGYYLTALCSAVHVLKSFMASDNEGTGSLDWRSSSLPACSSVLRVIIPDECNGSLQTRTLPVRPHTTTREVCRIIAHKARITNPQDYALFKLVDGEETLLSDIECPQDIRLAAKGKHCMLAYKRIDAKIAWPTAAQPSYG